MRSYFYAVAVLAIGCSPTTHFKDWELEDLKPDQGFSFLTPEFEVPGSEDVQDCYFFRAPDLNNGKDYFVSRFHMAINPGSHHMNVFRVKTILDLDPEKGEPYSAGQFSGTVVKGGACRESVNWADWPLVVNSQNSHPENPYTEWTLPEGVGQRFSPGELLMVQPHYVNSSLQPAPWKGRVGVNFYLSKEAEPVEMGTLFVTHQNIRICKSRPVSKFSGACALSNDKEVKVVAANGHFHGRGERFTIYSWDGVSAGSPAKEQMFYESLSWDEPPMVFGLDKPLPKGGGIYWTCEYRWREPSSGCDVVNERDEEQEGDCCYTFGNSVESSEHCNVFLYYYPKSEYVLCN